MTKSQAKWWLIAAPPMLVLFYVLSPGPILRLMDMGPGGGGIEDFLEVFYFPLEWLYRHVEPVERFYDWWFDACGS